MSTLNRRTYNNNNENIDNIVDIGIINPIHKEKINKRDVLEFVAQTTHELAINAFKSGDTFLAYLLTMASDEAKTSRNNLRLQ